MECTRDIERYTTMVNSQRLYVFLASLDSHLDGVRGRVLATTPLPNLQVAYAIVCVEANRQDAMLDMTPNEGAVMVIRKSSAPVLTQRLRKVFVSVLNVMVIIM